MHVPETHSPVGAESKHLAIPGHDKGLVAEVPEDAAQPDLGRELRVQETEDCLAAQVHLPQ